MGLDAVGVEKLEQGHPGDSGQDLGGELWGKNSFFLHKKNVRAAGLAYFAIGADKERLVSPQPPGFGLCERVGQKVCCFDGRKHPARVRPTDYTDTPEPLLEAVEGDLRGVGPKGWRKVLGRYVLSWFAPSRDLKVKKAVCKRVL